MLSLGTYRSPSHPVGTALAQRSRTAAPLQLQPQSSRRSDGPSPLSLPSSERCAVGARFHQDSLLGPQALEQRLRSLFDRVAPFTVGAEEELLLVDAQTLLPAPAAEYALALGQAIGGLPASFAARRSRQ